MKKAILGTKVGMTQMFREDGTMIPVTVVLAGPCPVVQIKTTGKDGYEAVQVAFGPVREKLITKPELGHLKKAGVAAHRYVREFKLDDTATYEVGQVIKADVFANGDLRVYIDCQNTIVDCTRNIFFPVSRQNCFFGILHILPPVLIYFCLLCSIQKTAFPLVLRKDKRRHKKSSPFKAAFFMPSFYRYHSIIHGILCQYYLDCNSVAY